MPSTEAQSTANRARLSTVFLPHGGGPWPFMDMGAFGPTGLWDRLRAYTEGLANLGGGPPNAVLVISAHWEEPVATVMNGAQPPMLYDYYGFPEETYRLQWPAPGAPAVAERICELLSQAGLESRQDADRGFDHGVFVPLMLAYPQAEVPTLQLSLLASLDPAAHIALGKAIEPLRDEGVFILGSGMSYHNLSNFRDPSPSARQTMSRESAPFDDWLADAVQGDAERRERLLCDWERAPHARACHPREEHLLPLMVVAGAAGGDRAHLPFRDHWNGARLSAVQFG